MDIVIASGNGNKIAELRKIAGSFAVNLISPAELQIQNNLPPIPEVEESEDTYRGNASLKARAFASWSGLPSLADDSGLAVDLLGGRPGIHSARYGGSGLSDRGRCEELLKEILSLGGFDSRVSARFHCCLVIAMPEGQEYWNETTLEGQVVNEFLGDKGFGYDPVVYIPSLKSSLAELEFEEVCRVGFRAQAFRELAEKTPELLPTRVYTSRH